MNEKTKAPKMLIFRDFFGVPGRIRTSALWSRSPTLFPAELQAHIIFIHFSRTIDLQRRSLLLYPAELQAHIKKYAFQGS